MAKTTNPNFRSPMLATATTSLPPGTWIAEEKFDGHRLIVFVQADGPCIAWSRTGNHRDLPLRLNNVLDTLPPGIYDGELIVPQGYSSSVSDHDNRGLLQYVVFDILQLLGVDTTPKPWRERRALLEEMFESQEDQSVVSLSETHEMGSWDDVERLVGQVWERGGEGLILKDINAIYRVGKRTKLFLKVKQCQAATPTIIGFAPSEGEVMNYGNYGTAVLLDDSGVVFPVKVLDDETRARLKKDEREEPGGWKTERLLSGVKVTFHTTHPWVGRRLHIEYQFRTPDGSYRHPRWNYLEGE